MSKRVHQRGLASPEYNRNAKHLSDAPGPPLDDETRQIGRPIPLGLEAIIFVFDILRFAVGNE